MSKDIKNLYSASGSKMTAKLFFLLVISVSLAYIVLADTATTSASIGNTVPVASSVSVAAGNLNGPDIFLNSNATIQLNFSATVTDDNGCSDINTVNLTFFRTNLTGGSGAANNNRNHYNTDCAVQAGTCTGAEDVAADYDCRMNVTWYLDPTDSGSHFAATDWTINVTPFDNTTEGTSGSNTYDVKTLTSFSLQNSSISFGALALNGNTTNNNNSISIVNFGNEAIDISLTGYAESSGDNLSMNCSIGTVPIHLLEYNNSAFTYGAGTDLSNVSTELDFDLDRGSEATPRPEKLSYYGFSVPDQGVGGSCSGNLVIVATSDPNID